MATILKSLLLCAFLPVMTLIAEDLGTWGHTYAIEEEDFLEHLRRKIASIPHNGVATWLKQCRDRIIELTHEPKATISLPEATHYSCYYFDPAVTLARDIQDAQGNEILKKGATFNPLTTVSLDGQWLFFDGSCPKQLAWAKRQEHGHWILVKGRPLELEEAELRPVYFDQGGVLSQQLKLQHVPVRVTQEHLKLKIEEIPVESGDV